MTGDARQCIMTAVVRETTDGPGRAKEDVMGKLIRFPVEKARPSAELVKARAMLMAGRGDGGPVVPAVAGPGETEPVVAPGTPAPKKEWLDRDEAIRRIWEGLKARSGKVWSVKGGRGTAWGWLKISAPPKRCTAGDFGYMTPEDCAELGRLLGLKGPVHFQGESVPASSEHYWEYVDRAEGMPPRCFGTPYWD